MSDNNAGAERTNVMVQDELRKLPSVDELLRSDDGQALVLSYGRSLTVGAIRESLAAVRDTIMKRGNQAPAAATIIVSAAGRLETALRPPLREVINATGVIVHTNLGRAPLSQRAIDAVASVAAGYSTLEYDLAAGSRGSRSVHAEGLLGRLTGAESALVVNNNAAAVLLMLTALCRGRKVLISRGQLVEIGGGFRVPDVMAQSGAQLVEVGTTNRTHLRDYERAIDADTAAILVAHHSNFKIIGFTTEPGLSELAQLAQERGIMLLFDQGSGALEDLSAYGLDPEATVLEALEAGVDVVAFSGDKLLGGPQAGILCGRQALIDQIKRHPLARAVRADKMALAALAATLVEHLTERRELQIPVWRMIAISGAKLNERAETWAAELRESGIACSVVDGESTVGGGSLPGTTLATRLLALEHGSVTALAAALRRRRVPVIGRVAEGRLLLDPRTVLPDQDHELLEAVRVCMGEAISSDE
ncbi:MAG: L-seryl-tRNA(Sec) selenium transferase [Candidatus Promineifilaceae bacterium]|nr:L-seryl-tRNA(Sec) selenium transferase [Candidatus Promineifilaceae bacterium]